MTVAPIQAVSIASIKIGKRHRHDMGDIAALGESIRAEGLLQAIGITEQNELVFGGRRLVAVRDVLKLSTIEARVVHVSSILAGEYAENELRKDFTPSERVAIADAVRAAIGNRQGKRTDKQLVENIPQVKGEKTREIAAKKAGFSNPKSYEQARSVVEHAVKEVIAQMDSGEMSISGAAAVARKPKDEQRRIAELRDEERKKAVREARENPSPKRLQDLEAARERIKQLPPKLKKPEQGDTELYGFWVLTVERIALREATPADVAALILDFDPGGKRQAQFEASVGYMAEIAEWMKTYARQRKKLG